MTLKPTIFLHCCTRLQLTYLYRETCISRYLFGNLPFPENQYLNSLEIKWMLNNDLLPGVCLWARSVVGPGVRDCQHFCIKIIDLGKNTSFLSCFGSKPSRLSSRAPIVSHVLFFMLLKNGVSIQLISVTTSVPTLLLECTKLYRCLQRIYF